jgi:hypothetical protein
MMPKPSLLSSFRSDRRLVPESADLGFCFAGTEQYRDVEDKTAGPLPVRDRIPAP